MRNKDLDKWLAENIMDWWLVCVEGMSSYWAFPILGEAKKGLPQCARMCLDWRPTESISDAFQVVEKMKEGGWFFILWNDSITNWAAGFDKDISQAEFNSVLEETIPLAISLAAKKAIEGW